MPVLHAKRSTSSFYPLEALFGGAIEIHCPLGSAGLGRVTKQIVGTKAIPGLSWLDVAI
jgi:hypothetical protein